MGRHRGFVYATLGDVETMGDVEMMGDVETMAVHSRVDGLSGFSYILETTPPAVYEKNYVSCFA